MTTGELAQFLHLKSEVQQLQAILLDTSVQNSEGLPESIKQSIQRCSDELRKIDLFVSGIKSSEIRQILRSRYILGLSWQQTAFSMGYHDESVPRKKLDRFLEKCPKCPK